jgi:vacuolar protein sorting-associated protein 54
VLVVRRPYRSWSHIIIFVCLFVCYTQVSAERQAALTRLCTGRAVASNKMLTKRVLSDDKLDETLNNHKEKKPIAEVEGVKYKVVWSSLLLVEMIMTNLSSAAHFQSLAANAVAKVSELLRLFNTRSTQLVLGAGAIHSAARLKSINAKHLSMVTQCLGMMSALLPHIRAALMAQLPAKQHTLLSDLDKIKKEYVDHNEKVLNKFVTIIGGIVEHGLAPRIANTDFDARARVLPIHENENDDVACCVFLDGILSTTRKMHQVLNSLLPPDHLQDVFSRIFAYVDQKVPTLLIALASATNTPNGSPSFCFPSTDDGKRRLILEVEFTTKKLNGLQGVLPWDFFAMTVLERKLEYKVVRTTTQEEPEGKEEHPAEVHNENGSQTPSTQDVGQELQISEAENGQAVAEDEGAPSSAKSAEAESGATSDTDEGPS